MQSDSLDSALFQPTSSAEALRGVNLGNWLLLERWMSPSLYPTREAQDEYTLCEALGPRAGSVLRKHRETWITEDDFVWLAARGINSVRIPFGYWILEADGPYVSSPDLLDFAIDCCERHGLSAVLDLHGLPGAQGPEHHTGRAHHFQWPADARHLAHSLDFIEQVAQRYAGREGIAGFSLVNEPHESIERGVLVDFYERAGERVRRHMPAKDVALVIAAYPENLMPDYHRCLGDTPNVWTDVHLYQSFCPWPNQDPVSYLRAAADRHERLTQWMARGPVIVGEWSLSWAPELHEPLARLPRAAYDQFFQAYGRIQLDSFAHSTGWYFWSYRTETRPNWSFRDSVERGWLPDDFTPRPSLPADEAFSQAIALAASAGMLEVAGA